MDGFNIENEDNKLFETEIGPEEATGFSALTQKDKFLGSSFEQRKDNKVETNTYQVEGVNIDVNYRSIFPKVSSHSSEEVNPESKIIFLPGWSLDSGAKSAEIVGQAFSDASNREALIIDTKPSENTKDSLYKEAQVIAQLVKEKGVRHLVIAGHSEGVIKSVNLAAVLQKQKEAGELDIAVDGVILMESIGLYDQGNAVKFAANFVKDGIIDAQTHTIKAEVSKREGIGKTEARTARLTMDVVFGTLKELVRTNGIKYPQRLLSQIKEMKGVQAHLAEVKAPVILIHGTSDLVANPEKTLPGYKNLDREEALRQEFFPNSPYIRMITGERLGTHAMPVYRAEQVAKDSLYLLDRFNREQSQAAVK